MFSYSDIMRRYMDALKFAFEILVVGALALPWIMVLVWMFPDPASGKQRDILKFFQPFSPVGARPAVTAVALVAIGYLLGSAVSRISRDFFNDELLGSFPTEDQIRDGVYYDEYCTEQVLSRLDLPNRGHRMLDGFCPTKPDKPGPFLSRNHVLFYSTPLKALPDDNGRTYLFDPEVQEMFRLQESELLLRGQDRVDRLKQYFDQITVLRGAAFERIHFVRVVRVRLLRKLEGALVEVQHIFNSSHLLASVPPGFRGPLFALGALDLQREIISSLP
jgi:hypothetical protein